MHLSSNGHHKAALAERNAYGTRFQRKQAVSGTNTDQYYERNNRFHISSYILHIRHPRYSELMLYGNRVATRTPPPPTRGDASRCTWVFLENGASFGDWMCKFNTQDIPIVIEVHCSCATKQQIGECKQRRSVRSVRSKNTKGDRASTKAGCEVPTTSGLLSLKSAKGFVLTLISRA